MVPVAVLQHGSVSMASFIIRCSRGGLRAARCGSGVHLTGRVVLSGSLRRHRDVHEQIIQLGGVGGRGGGGARSMTRISLLIIVGFIILNVRVNGQYDMGAWGGGGEGTIYTLKSARVRKT